MFNFETSRSKAGRLKMPMGLAVAAGMLIGAGVTAPAHAAYFVATYAQSSISAENAAIAYGYNIDSLGHLTSSGFQSSGGCGLSNCAASGLGSLDTTGTLTSSFDRTLMTSDNLSHDGSQVFHTSASALARADLSLGAIGVSGGGTHLDVNGTGGQDGGTGIGAAIANDTLHFSIGRADPSTVTYIGVTYKVDGVLDYAGLGVEAAASVQPRLSVGTASFFASIDANGSLVPSVTASTATHWVSYSIAPDTPGQITFHGVYALSGARDDVTIQENLNVQCGGGDSCDYAHTAVVSFSLPSNVTFSSDSGVFLTGVAAVPAVPEPETSALMLGGLAALGWVARRRRAG